MKKIKSRNPVPTRRGHTKRQAAPKARRVKVGDLVEADCYKTRYLIEIYKIVRRPAQLWGRYNVISAIRKGEELIDAIGCFDNPTDITLSIPMIL